MPTVSIIIATYNSEADIRTAIDSVRSMTYNDWELLVMDGASTDATCQIVSEYAAVDTRICLHSEPDKGTYDAFNKGWKVATGTWVHYLGSDDSMTTDGIEQLLSETIPDDVDVVSGHCWALKIDGERKTIRSHGLYGCHQGKLTRRSALAEMGGFDLQYRILADMDLYFRMRNAGRKAINRDCHVANFKMDGNSQRLSHQWAFTREMYNIRRHDAEDKHPLLHTLTYSAHSCLSIIYRKMRKILLPCLLLLSLPAYAQVHTLSTDITFNYTGGTGTFNAYYITANNHGALTTKPNTFGVRAALNGEFSSEDWLLTYGIDAIEQQDPYSPLFLQQLYARAQWRDYYLEIGAKEHNSALRQQRLSSGSLLWSGNSHPIPQIRIGTEGFITVPYTNGWLEAMADADYGYFMDSHFLRDRYDEYNPGGNTLTGYAQSFLTTEAFHHQKRLFLRTNPDKEFVGTVGIEHAVQFGGKTTNYINNTINGTLKQSIDLKDFLKVLIPSGGDSDAAVGDQNFIYGNHVGTWHAMFTWNIDQNHSVNAYLENPFEDGSGFLKRNGWDGLWGIEYKADPDSYVSGIVLEYLQTTDQSGAVHWAPQDHYGEMSGEARGADEYYNNYFYCGYAHFGQSIGSPMLMSPIYNRDSYLRFVHNRVQAWHAGIEGCIVNVPATKRLPATRVGYRCLLSYRNAYGTMAIPSTFIHHDLSLLTELSCTFGDWQMTAAYGHDNGSLMGDNNTLQIAFKYHGKIF